MPSYVHYLMQFQAQNPSLHAGHSLKHGDNTATRKHSIMHGLSSKLVTLRPSRTCLPFVRSLIISLASLIVVQT